MICRMCLMDSPEVLDIFASEKTAFNIATTIAQHFWFEPKYDDLTSNLICDACWRKIESFHEYYLCVEEAQRKLSEGPVVKQEPPGQEPRDHPMVSVTQHFVKLEPEESYGAFNSLGGNGSAVEAIVCAVDQHYEQDYTLDDKSIVYSYLIEEVAHASTNNSRHEEEVRGRLHNENNIRNLSANKLPRASENANTFVHHNRKLVDSVSEACIEKTSPRGRQTDSISTDLNNKRKKKSFLECKEDDLIIAQNIELKCDVCSGIFVTFAELSRHMIEAHRRTGYVKCCDRKFFKKCTVIDHLNQHFEPDYFKCGKCGKSFSDNPCLQKHLARHEYKKSSAGQSKNNQKKDYGKSKDDDLIIARNMELKCDLCGDTFVTFAEVSRHMVETHGKTGYVKCCDRKFFKKCTILDHLHSHTDADYFKCKKCNKTFSAKRCLARHLLRHEQKDSGQPKKRQSFLKCKEDDQKIARHVVLKCDICGRDFGTFAEISRHMRKAYRRTGYVKCCNRKFYKKCVLLDHLHSHSKSDDLKSNKTDKSIKELKKSTGAKEIEVEALLAEHQVEYSEITDQKTQPKKGEVCSKNPRSLKIPVRKILLDGKSIKRKKFPCKMCSSKLVSKEGLKAHVKYVHKSEREFICNVCEKGFKRMLTLKEHMTRHTGELLYTCPHCPRTFANSGNLSTHRKKAHRKEWDESIILRGMKRVNRRNMPLEISKRKKRK